MCGKILTKIYALHGFLGRPGDWDGILKNVAAVDVFRALPIVPMESWAASFNRLTENKHTKNILMGYSLGGRLAVHALLQNPAQWSAAILISTHLGLASQEEKATRLESDMLWAKRFESAPWEQLMHAWNGQSAFHSGTFSFERQEREYQRSDLSAALEHWSLGTQKDLVDSLSKVNVPVCWMTGANDQKYIEQASRVILRHPLSRKYTVTNAGHRMPWEQKNNFIKNVEQFLEQIT